MIYHENMFSLKIPKCEEKKIDLEFKFVKKNASFKIQVIIIKFGLLVITFSKIFKLQKKSSESKLIISTKI